MSVLEFRKKSGQSAKRPASAVPQRCPDPLIEAAFGSFLDAMTAYNDACHRWAAHRRTLMLGESTVQGDGAHGARFGPVVAAYERFTRAAEVLGGLGVQFEPDPDGGGLIRLYGPDRYLFGWIDPHPSRRAIRPRRS